MNQILQSKYNFLEKISQEPDLKDDVGQYIVKPLMALYDLEEKIKKLKLNSKTKKNNLDLQFDVEDLSNRRLPQIFDEYCSFPIDYRNQEKISLLNKTTGTLKEMLLDNLSKIIQEIHGLQKKFYKENQVNFIVQSSYIDTKAQAFEGTPVEILENKFDYEKFQTMFLNGLNDEKKQNNLVKVDININNKTIDLNKTVSENKNENIEPATEGMSLVQFLLVLGVVAIVMIAVMVSYQNVSNSLERNMAIKTLNKIGSDSESFVEQKTPLNAVFNTLVQTYSADPAHADDLLKKANFKTDPKTHYSGIIDHVQLDGRLAYGHTFYLEGGSENQERIQLNFATSNPDDCKVISQALSDNFGNNVNDDCKPTNIDFNLKKPK